jgi:phage/plasmid-associated DNA primase
VEIHPHQETEMNTSDGFFRRAAIIEMTRQFSVGERDIELEGKLSAEIQGIATWAVHGLIRMKKRGSFELPASAINTADTYRRESDHVLSFILDECKPSDKGMRPSELFECYKKYARENNFSMLNINTFGKRLAGAGISRRKSVGSNFWLLESIHSPKKIIPLAEYND